MKRLIRIAPFLIVLALGIVLLPRVQAVEITSQNFQEPTKKRIESNFHGVMIIPNYTEQLLYSQSSIPTDGFGSEMGNTSNVSEKSEKNTEKEPVFKANDSNNQSACYSLNTIQKCGNQYKNY